MSTRQITSFSNTLHPVDEKGYPDLTVEKQAETDVLNGPFLFGTRIFAVYAKPLYPAVVLESNVDYSCYKIKFMEDASEMWVPYDAIIPLAALEIGDQLTVFDESTKKCTCVEIIEKPSKGDCDEWFNASFEVKQTVEEGVVESLHWSQLHIKPTQRSQFKGRYKHNNMDAAKVKIFSADKKVNQVSETKKHVRRSKFRALVRFSKTPVKRKKSDRISSSKKTASNLKEILKQISNQLSRAKVRPYVYSNFLSNDLESATEHQKESDNNSANQSIVEQKPDQEITIDTVLESQYEQMSIDDASKTEENTLDVVMESQPNLSVEETLLPTNSGSQVETPKSDKQLISSSKEALMEISDSMPKVESQSLQNPIDMIKLESPSSNSSQTITERKERIQKLEVLTDLELANFFGQQAWQVYNRDKKEICTLKFGDKSIEIPAICLTARSDTFKQMLSSNDKIIKIENCGSEQAFMVFVEYLFCGSCENLKENVSDLLAFANEFKIDGLKSDCLQLMRSSINKDSLFSYLQMAVTNEDIKHLVLDFVKQTASSDLASTLFTNSQWFSFSATNVELAKEISTTLLSLLFAK